jgi:hypothetical protein
MNKAEEVKEHHEGETSPNKGSEKHHNPAVQEALRKE